MPYLYSKFLYLTWSQHKYMNNTAPPFAVRCGQHLTCHS